MLCFMHPSPTETWHQTTQGGGRERMKAKGGRRRSLGSSCSQCQACWPPQHGAGVLSARQAWGRANWERLGPEACGGEGGGREACLGFLLIAGAVYCQATPGKGPFLWRLMTQPREMAVWVSLHTTGRPLLALPRLQPHTDQLDAFPCSSPDYFCAHISTLRAHPNDEATP